MRLLRDILTGEESPAVLVAAILLAYIVF